MVAAPDFVLVRVAGSVLNTTSWVLEAKPHVLLYSGEQYCLSGIWNN